MRIAKEYFSFVAIFGLFLLIATPVIFSRPAHASSVYDTALRTTDVLALNQTGDGGHGSRTVTNDWNSLMFDCTNWTASALYYNYQNCDYYKNIFNSVRSSGTGWAVSQYTAKISLQNENVNYEPGDTYIKLTFASSSSVHGEFTDLGSYGYGNHLSLLSDGADCSIILAMPDRSDTTHTNPVVTGADCVNQSQVVVSNDGEGALYSIKSFLINIPITYPTGYAGIIVTDASTDSDDDGLSRAQELTQGTSDNNKDSDRDGLSDFTESVYNPNRDTVFCGIECAYPNPTAKDLYVEVDWMKDANDRVFKPDSDQLDSVKNAFAAHGVTVHFDTGQYGGGDELPTYAEDFYFAPNPNETDFFDYKNGTSTDLANFKADRNGIWRYLISGYHYMETPGSSGVSYAGSDAIFISTGLIEDNSSSFGYSDLDMAIAGTIIHELGHSTCLSNPNTGDPAYPSQSSSCRHSNIDNWNAPSTYDSSMNYNKQMFMVGYSDGTNGAPGDHDDWSAIKASLVDFTDSDRRINAINQGTRKRAVKNMAIIRGITKKEAEEAKRQGALGVTSKY